MSGGFQFIDIILLAMVAAFLVLQLRRVLGRRDGHEGNHRDPFSAKDDRSPNNVVTLPDRTADDTVDSDDEVLDMTDGTPSLSAGLTQIKVADPTFDDREFLSGARIAFEMILSAYADGATATLETLLSPEVYSNFAHAIDDRESAGETLKNTLVGTKSATLVEAFMDGSMANVTVKFVTEQINVTTNAAGDVVDGDPNLVSEVTDFWTFARDTKSRDPNWILVATRSLD